MAKASELEALLENRENLYSFLSRIYLLEVDQAQLTAMKEMQFPGECAEDRLSEGYRMMGEFLSTAGCNCLDELAADYAGVFLAAGMAQGLAAFPYESVYTDKQRQVMQRSEADAAAMYAAKGLKASPSVFMVPNDHIGLETAFMALLCDQAKQALLLGDTAALADSVREQKSFLRAHLLNWHGGFCHDLERYTKTGFYKAIAKITYGFLELERRLMDMGEELWVIE